MHIAMEVEKKKNYFNLAYGLLFLCTIGRAIPVIR